MRRFNRQHLKDLHFDGFIRIAALQPGRSLEQVPDQKGIYVVLRTMNKPVRFLTKSAGGHFKGRSPTVPVDTLKAEWVSKAAVVYIGKAGGRKGHATLRSRIEQYLAFGRGDPVGHWGGRYIWQLADSKDLLLCWKPTPRSDPRQWEKKLLRQFEETCGKLPFANLQH